MVWDYWAAATVRGCPSGRRRWRRRRFLACRCDAAASGGEGFWPSVTEGPGGPPPSGARVRPVPQVRPGSRPRLLYDPDRRRPQPTAADRSRPPPTAEPAIPAIPATFRVRSHRVDFEFESAKFTESRTFGKSSDSATRAGVLGFAAHGAFIEAVVYEVAAVNGAPIQAQGASRIRIVVRPRDLGS